MRETSTQLHNRDQAGGKRKTGARKLLIRAFLFSLLAFIGPVHGQQAAKQAPLSRPEGLSGWSQTTDPDYKHAPQEVLERWRDLKFGMRIHFGVYSHLGVEASWPLVEGSPDFRKVYSTLYEVFLPSAFDAGQWAALAERAGMKYFVITTRHHDGFSMYDTKTLTTALRRPITGQKVSRLGIGPVEQVKIHYSVMDSPFKRDVVRELADAFRKRGLGVGFYYSHPDWNDPDYRWDSNSPQYDPKYSKETDPQGWKRFIARNREQLRELSTDYGELIELSFDHGFPKDAWPDMVDMVKMVRKLQPNVLMRERGLGPYGDFTTPEHWVPKGPDDPRVQMPWEAIEQWGTEWAYTPQSTYKSKQWIVTTLVDVVAKGGNLMAGVAPRADGTFPKETIERIEFIGDWLRVNGEGIYKTRPWRTFQEGEKIRFTRSKDNRYVYAFAFDWPGEKLVLKSVRAQPGSRLSMFGVSQPLKWRQDSNGLAIDIPDSIARKKPCELVWGFKIEAQPYQQKYE